MQLALTYNSALVRHSYLHFQSLSFFFISSIYTCQLVSLFAASSLLMLRLESLLYRPLLDCFFFHRIGWPLQISFVCEVVGANFEIERLSHVHRGVTELGELMGWSSLSHYYRSLDTSLACAWNVCAQCTASSRDRILLSLEGFVDFCFVFWQALSSDTTRFRVLSSVVISPTLASFHSFCDSFAWSHLRRTTREFRPSTFQVVGTLC